ncbi:MAG: hypothetical protein Q8O88_03940 [bacterium]|nr:hypothetical protein [bacterium]
MKNKYYIFNFYTSSNGGVNNLHIARISSERNTYVFLKEFSSKINMAEIYAKRWAKKNKINLISFGV